MGYYYGTGFSDYLYGSASGDVMYGYGGNDYLQGYGGTDTLYGGPGNDVLDGSYYTGGAQFDALIGGAGYVHSFWVAPLVVFTTWVMATLSSAIGIPAMM
jgi:hypothetical protein